MFLQSHLLEQQAWQALLDQWEWRDPLDPLDLLVRNDRSQGIQNCVAMTGL